MLTRLAAAIAVIVVACPAAADSTSLARADAVAFTARVTATRLRHRWDDARAKDALLAACIEPKLNEAMMLTTRIDLKRVELRDGVATARAHAARALETLDGRRADIEAEATACAPHVFQPVGGSHVTMSILRSIATIEPGVEPAVGAAFESELLRALIAPNVGR